jgi:hypothetical protein
MIAPAGTPVRNLNTGRAGVVTQQPDARVGPAETAVTYDGHDTVVELNSDLEVAEPSQPVDR